MKTEIIVLISQTIQIGSLDVERTILAVHFDHDFRLELVQRLILLNCWWTYFVQLALRALVLSSKRGNTSIILLCTKFCISQSWSASWNTSMLFGILFIGMKSLGLRVFTTISSGFLHLNPMWCIPIGILLFIVSSRRGWITLTYWLMLDFEYRGCHRGLLVCLICRRPRQSVLRRRCHMVHNADEFCTLTLFFISTFPKVKSVTYCFLLFLLFLLLALLLFYYYYYIHIFIHYY